MEKNPVNMILEMMEKIDDTYIPSNQHNNDYDEYSDEVSQMELSGATSKTFSGEIPVMIKTQKKNDKKGQSQLKTVDPTLDFGEKKESLIAEIISQRSTIGAGELVEDGSFEHYDIPKVKDLCNNINNRIFTISNSIALDYDRFASKFPHLFKTTEGQFDSSEFGKWYKLCKNYNDRNKNGRFGLIFELLMGNIPDSYGEADLENIEDKSKSVEAKSKTSKSQGITIGGAKIESLANSLKNVSSDLYQSCNEIVMKISNIINNVIMNDINKYNGYKIDYIIQNGERKIVTITPEDLGKEKNILTLKVIVSKPDTLFKSDKQVVEYSVLSKTYMDDKIGAIHFRFIVMSNNEIIGNEKDLSFDMPIDLIIHKITEKCPNIVIAFGSDYDEVDNTNKLGVQTWNTCYRFNNFEYYTLNKNIKNNDYAKCMADLISKKVFNVQFYVTGNISQDNYFKNNKKMHSLSMGIIPSFNERYFTQYMQFGNSLYTKC